MARKFAELQNGQREAGSPKSAAGVRTIAIPAALIQVTGEHLAEYPASGQEPDHPWTVGRRTAPEQLPSVGRLVQVGHRCRSAGLHFHDVLHTDNILAAATGASTRD